MLDRVADRVRRRIGEMGDLTALSAAELRRYVAGLLGELLPIVGMFTLTWTFLRQPRWRTHAAWLMLFPAGALSLLFVQTQGPWVGLMQRALVTIISAWLVLVALKIPALAVSAESSTPAPDGGTAVRGAGRG